jgi:cbb3-type cytochrome oxidase cytochrome c subunit
MTRSNATYSLLIVLTIVTVSFGGLVEIVPLFFQKSTTTPVNELVKPYDPCAWRDATSTSAKAATTAIRR